MKRIPVSIPLENDGSLCDVINDFINSIQTVTGGDVDLKCDLDGNLTIYYESYPNKNKHPEDKYDLEVLYRGDNVKSLSMSEKNKQKSRKVCANRKIPIK